jgi:hypothetical protein
MYRIVVVSAAVVAAALVAVPSAAAAAQDLTSLVNPFVGTQNDGNTFPGASMPFGMVQEPRQRRRHRIRLRRPDDLRVQPDALIRSGMRH